jgi:hypothetical protein
MGTTPIYGFPYPDPSDLVANYPALGQQLAEDIEDVLPTLGGVAPVTPTTIANSGGTATLTAHTVTYSAVTSVSLNGIFTSTYENYLLVIKGAISAADQTVFRLRAAGSDATGSNYKTSWQVATDGGAEDFSSYASTGRTTGFISASNVAYTFFTSFEVSAPQLAVPTLCTGKMINTQVLQGTVGTVHNVSTAYDGFTLFGLSGTLTGTISAYGYTK